MIKTIVVTAPVEEPITVAAVKTHLRLLASETSEDGLIASYIKAARETLEQETGIHIAVKGVHYVFDPVPSGIIELSDLASVSAVELEKEGAWTPYAAFGTDLSYGEIKPTTDWP